MTTTTAMLHGYGRIRWNQLTAALAGAEAAWADYTGFRIGPAPAEPPPYTHLWAWTTRWLVRARIDANDAIVGALLLDVPDPQAPALEPVVTDRVGYVRRQARTWPTSERRVGPLPPPVADRIVDLYEVPGAHPVTFIGLR